MNDISEIHACVKRDLCLETSRSCFSRIRVTKISITWSTERHLNRFSMHVFVA
jgi:hypothetical protein